MSAITLLKKKILGDGKRRRLQTRPPPPLSIAQRGAAFNEPSLSSHANEAPWQIVSPKEIALSETEGAQVLKLLKVFLFDGAHSKLYEAGGGARRPARAHTVQYPRRSAHVWLTALSLRRAGYFPTQS